MSLKYHPKVGQILICNYNTGFQEPEMVKRRPVIVISPRLPHRDRLCTVVPISTSAPRKDVLYQCKVQLPYKLPPPWDDPVIWAKCDMLATVAFDRLSLIHNGRDHKGKRRYLTPRLDEDELNKVRAAMLNALGMPNLAPHLDK